jgi:hypothetical protein
VDNIALHVAIFTGVSCVKVKHNRKTGFLPLLTTKQTIAMQHPHSENVHVRHIIIIKNPILYRMLK